MTATNWIDQAKRDQRDAERWRKLVALCGSLRDGSQTIVKLIQDDATNTAFIVVGSDRDPNRKEYFEERGSFESAIDLVVLGEDS